MARHIFVFACMALIISAITATPVDPSWRSAASYPTPASMQWGFPASPPPPPPPGMGRSPFVSGLPPWMSSFPSFPFPYMPATSPSGWTPSPSFASKPTLYFDKTSPQVRAILMLIEAGHIDVNMSPVDLSKNEQMKPEFLAINPLHTVPTLTDGDLTLTDSHVILVYLAEKYMGDNSSFWPQGALRYKVLNRMLYSATVFYRRLSDAVNDIFTSQTRKDKVAQYVTKIQEQYTILEGFLGKTTFMAANQLTLADISISTILGSANILAPVDPAKWPRLANWFNQVKMTSFYAKANAEGIAAIKSGLSQSTDYPINPLA